MSQRLLINLVCAAAVITSLYFMYLGIQALAHDAFGPITDHMHQK